MAADLVENRNGDHALELSHVTVSGDDDARADLMYGSMRADAGDLLLIQVVNLHEAEVWSDVATGLISPMDGRVSVLGNDMSELDWETGNWLRGRFGRVFSRGNWLDRLSILDNILLSSRHHTDRGHDDLAAEASVLAASFGMPGIPIGMPERIERIDLQRAACVRAFLGDPLLIFLEDPTYAVHQVLLKPLVDAIRDARDRGAAVLWFTPSMDIWRDRSIPVTRRYRMAANSLMEVEGR